jgi:flavin-dependent dehydrogenase
VEVGISLGHHNSTVEYLDFAIVGGGVAGLSVANQLVDQNIEVTLIEGSSYPKHKVCGEVLSPECHPILEEWGLPFSRSISHVEYIINKQSYLFSLPLNLGSCSRYELDSQLYQRAVSKGLKAKLNTQVKHILFFPDELYPYELILSTHTSIKTKTLFLGTKSLLSSLWKPTRYTKAYLGFKAHFKDPSNESRLKMVINKKGYYGICPLGNSYQNLAGLIKIKHLHDGTKLPIQYFDPLTEIPSDTLETMQWYTVDVPEFKKHPHFFHPCPALYLIGDAAAQIAPASGDGLAMALASGQYAAHFALNKETRLYQKFLKKSFQQRVKWAKNIHNLHLSPFKSKLALSACQSFPAIFQRLFTLTRGGM